MALSEKSIAKTASIGLTPKAMKGAHQIPVDDSKRLKEITELVQKNNNSTLSTSLIVCQIYMESRFKKDATVSGSSAIGLMQLLRSPIREIYRQENLKRPRDKRLPEAQIYRDADKFHDGGALLDEATNIRYGTVYMQILIENQKKRGSADYIEEAYKDYRGIRNGIYYRKIKAASDELQRDPNNMQILIDMVK